MALCTTPIWKHLCFPSAWYFILKLLILLVSEICYLLLISMFCIISEAKLFSSIFCILMSYHLSCSFYSADNKFLFTLRVFNVSAISPFPLRLQIFPLTLLFALNLFIFILDFIETNLSKTFFPVIASRYLSWPVIVCSTMLLCSCFLNFVWTFKYS